MINLNSPDGSMLPPKIHVIPLWRILFSISLLIVLLLISSILVCGTNQVCRAHLPTLNNLLQSSFVSPFLITALNSILSLHLFTSMGIYYKTGSRLSILSAVIVYISVVITMFVFPFTDWSKNWANITIIVALILWMIITVLALKHFYRHRLVNRRKMLFFSGCTCFLYTCSSIMYIVCRGVGATDTLILISEIFSGFGIAGFLMLCVAHIWDLQFKIQV